MALYQTRAFNSGRGQDFFFYSITAAESRDSSVGIATRLRAGRSGFQGSISGGGWEFFSSPPRPERLWGPPSLLFNGYQGHFPGGKATGA
jgi:hypothetical protein